MPSTQEKPDIKRISGAISAWNNGDVAALIAMFADDVAYCSPFIAETNASKWVQGTQEVATHLLALRNRFSNIDLIEVLTGAGFTNLLLRHAGGHISMLIEPDEHRRARRVIVCHSSASLKTT